MSFTVASNLRLLYLMHVAPILQLQVLAFVKIVCMTFALPHVGHWSFLAPSQCPFMLRILIFWNMMLCHWVSSSLHLKWTHCFHPLGSSGPWRWFFVDHLTCEDEGNTFLWNARNLSYNDSVFLQRTRVINFSPMKNLKFAPSSCFSLPLEFYSCV